MRPSSGSANIILGRAKIVLIWGGSGFGAKFCGGPNFLGRAKSQEVAYYLNLIR